MPQISGGASVAAPWLIERSASPTVIVPLRATAEFGATSTLTVPAPEPEIGGVGVIQMALLDADQAQPPGAVTVTVAAPPAAANWGLSMAN